MSADENRELGKREMEMEPARCSERLTNDPPPDAAAADTPRNIGTHGTVLSHRADSECA